MKIFESVKPRSNQLIGELCRVWQASVRATHDFLTDDDILQIADYVPEALKNIDILLIAQDGERNLIGFAGIDKQKLEMLFIHPNYFKRGTGKSLFHLAVDQFGVCEVDVNEQNFAARVFYEHMGFVVFARDEFDAQGNPFPILHMKSK